MPRNEENLSLSEIKRLQQEGLQGEVGGDGDADPVEILTDDHAHLQLLFNEYEGDNRAERREMLHRILAILELHLRLEEESLYPAIVHQGAEGRRRVAEAREMHQRIRRQMETLSQARRMDRKTDAAFGALEMLLEAHAEWEEANIHPFTYDMRQGDVAAIGEAMLGIRGASPIARRRGL